MQFQVLLAVFLVVFVSSVRSSPVASCGDQANCLTVYYPANGTNLDGCSGTSRTVCIKWNNAGGKCIKATTDTISHACPAYHQTKVDTWADDVPICYTVDTSVTTIASFAVKDGSGTCGTYSGTVTGFSTSCGDQGNWCSGGQNTECRWNVTVAKCPTSSTTSSSTKSSSTTSSSTKSTSTSSTSSSSSSSSTSGSSSSTSGSSSSTSGSSSSSSTTGEETTVVSGGNSGGDNNGGSTSSSSSTTGPASTSSSSSTGGDDGGNQNGETSGTSTSSSSSSSSSTGGSTSGSNGDACSNLDTTDVDGDKCTCTNDADRNVCVCSCVCC